MISLLPFTLFVRTLPSQLTDPTGKTVVVETKEGAKISAAIVDARKKVQMWRSKQNKLPV